MTDTVDRTIEVWEYLPEYEAERDELLATVDRVFRSGRLVLGESLAGVEREFAAYCGVAHGVGVDNGTNAIVLGLRALGVQAEDEVITTSNAAPGTVVAIQQLGARAVFVDIDPATYLMDVGKLKAAITRDTTCIVPAHLFGQCVDMDRVQRTAGDRGIPILEDCAHAPGATFRNRRAGSMSHAAAFSFHPTKVLGAYGDGGMVVTDDGETARRLRCLRHFGMEGGHTVVDPGYDSRLDEVQAEILRRKLTRLESYIDGRRAIAARYREGLADIPALVLPKETGWGRHVYHVYAVRHPERDRIVALLKDLGINVGIPRPRPLHMMSGFNHLGYGPGDLPETEAAARECLSLPMFPSLTRDRQDRVIDAIRKVAG